MAFKSGEEGAGDCWFSLIFVSTGGIDCDLKCDIVELLRVDICELIGDVCDAYVCVLQMV